MLEILTMFKGQNSITLEQARAFVALSEAGSFLKAASLLRKQHTGVIYLLKGLEAALNLKLLDRTGYRPSLTPSGLRILDECRELLAQNDKMAQVARELAQGWEPKLHVVVDGMFPIQSVLNAISKLKEAHAHTHIEVTVEYHQGVEEAFVKKRADLVIAFLPFNLTYAVPVGLAKIEAVLVAAHQHPLTKKGTGEAVEAHTLITVRGSSPRLGLSTAHLVTQSKFQVNDFYAKKEAILSGIGYGWLPKYMIESELKSKRLRPVIWSGSSRHFFNPVLYFRKGQLGRAGKFFMNTFTPAKGRA